MLIAEAITITADEEATSSRGGFFVGGDGDRVSNQHIINLLRECFTWHRAIFSGGYPPNIVAANAFHIRVRDGSEWDHTAMDTRIDKHSQGVNPENCIGSAAIAARLNQTKK